MQNKLQLLTQEGEQLGLTADELAFYDALTKPQAIKDFYENEELICHNERIGRYPSKK